MKKMLTIMLAGVLMLAVSGCGAEPQHKVSYVSGEKLTVLEQYDCVAVYTQYTNDSSETAVPADEVTVKAFQNGVELSPLVPTGDRTNGYVQCDSSVQSGTTADVVWLFELDDDSTVSVELSGGEKVRCMLSKMMLSGANVVLLDQPTNHLDMESIQAVNKGLEAFPGVVLLASHDHELLTSTCNRVIAFQSDGTIVDRYGTYDDYLNWLAEQKKD